MTLVKPAPDAQVREEKQNKRTWPFPHPRHGKRWLILGVIALLFLAFAGKFLLGQGPAAAAITYTEEMVATRTITNSLTGSGHPPARKFLYGDHPDRRRGPLRQL